VQVRCQRRFRRHFELIRLKQWELGEREPLGTDGGTPESYKISQMRPAAPPFFGRRRKPKHVQAHAGRILFLNFRWPPESLKRSLH